MNKLYPPTFSERNLAGDVHIEPEDLADYAQPPGKRERYTETGWRKAREIGIAELRIEDFGGLSDSAATSQEGVP